MYHSATILAAGGEGLSDFLPFIIIAGLIYLGNFIRRKMEDREAEAQRHKANESRDRSAAPARPAAQQTLPGSLREVIARATAAPKSSPREPDQPPPAPTRKRRRNAPEPQPAQIIAEEPKSAAQPVAPPIAKKIKPTSRAKVDLSTRDKLRQAMIYHEIFGLPKSLRTDGENWDQA